MKKYERNIQKNYCGNIKPQSEKKNFKKCPERNIRKITMIENKKKNFANRVGEKGNRKADKKELNFF